jgi:hypothetical protein
LRSILELSRERLAYLQTKRDQADLRQSQPLTSPLISLR